ncbi:MAG: HAMP domain-containing sensor histidine kinase [Clostridia bacterium]|nr:HAMP domain-containing sensor histidine kinase [Clostridia bacterium]MDD3832101.1 HAMP domain-containing sensor histidine kinase [Clostridia bacterium]
MSNKLMDKQKTKQMWQFTLFVFILMLSSYTLIATVTGFVYEYVNFETSVLQPYSVLIITLATTLVLVLIFSPFAYMLVFRQINKIITALQSVASGNFDTYIPPTKGNIYNGLYDNFNAMTKELSSIEAMRRDFVQNYSHELKTPIVSISGFAKLLSNHNLTEEQRQDYLDIIQYECDRLVRLSTNTLVLSKLESQHLITDKTVFSLAEQIRQCVLLLEKDWTDKQIDMQINLQEVNYESNPAVLQQVWLNLLSNAIKFTPCNGRISISLVQSTNSIEVIFSDNGCGIKPQSLPRIFDKYYQEDNSHTTNGNGLGLPIVKQIIQLVRGTIKVNSQPCEGSTFTVTLPIVDS